MTFFQYGHSPLALYFSHHWRTLAVWHVSISPFTCPLGAAVAQGPQGSLVPKHSYQTDILQLHTVLMWLLSLIRLLLSGDVARYMIKTERTVLRQVLDWYVYAIHLYVIFNFLFFMLL